MVCPRCNGDFRAGFFVCPDCGIELQKPEEDETRPDPPRPRDSSRVVLRTADPSTLALARARLTTAEISFAINNESMTGLFPSALAEPTLDSKFRAAEIEVLESRVGEALALLEDLEGAVFDAS